MVLYRNNITRSTKNKKGSKYITMDYPLFRILNSVKRKPQYINYIKIFSNLEKLIGTFDYNEEVMASRMCKIYEKLVIIHNNIMSKRQIINTLSLVLTNVEILIIMENSLI